MPGSDYAGRMSTYGIETLTLALPDETPAEADEREAVQAGALDYADTDAVSAWAEQIAYEAWLDDEQERVMWEQEQQARYYGCF